MTLCARTNKFGGIVRPICLAAFKLITNSNLVGCSTGISAGFVPFEDFVDHYRDASVRFRLIGPVGHQAAVSTKSPWLYIAGRRCFAARFTNRDRFEVRIGFCVTVSAPLRALTASRNASSSLSGLLISIECSCNRSSRATSWLSFHCPLEPRFFGSHSTATRDEIGNRFLE